MASRADAVEAEVLRKQAQVAGSVRFDWIMILLAACVTGGLFIDGWAHTHGEVDDSFFTPWHGILYSGLFATLAYTIPTLVRNNAKGYAWLGALPAGYMLSMFGALIFGIGGVGDLVWHTLFGIEGGIEALFSPTHLMLALGITLIASGPLRAAWVRSERKPPGLRQFMPTIISIALTLSVLTFFIFTANPVAQLMGAGVVYRSPVSLVLGGGVAGLLLTVGISMGIVLLAVRRWTLPFGSLTLVLGINAILMSALNEQHDYPVMTVLAFAMGGFAGDVLLRVLNPSAKRVGAFRVFAFSTPLITHALYFVSLQLSTGIWWTIHLWTGVIVLTGVVGLLLSYLALPASMPVEE